MGRTIGESQEGDTLFPDTDFDVIDKSPVISTPVGPMGNNDQSGAREPRSLAQDVASPSRTPVSPKFVGVRCSGNGNQLRPHKPSAKETYIVTFKIEGRSVVDVIYCTKSLSTI